MGGIVEHELEIFHSREIMIDALENSEMFQTRGSGVLVKDAIEYVMLGSVLLTIAFHAEPRAWIDIVKHQQRFLKLLKYQASCNWCGDSLCILHPNAGKDCGDVLLLQR